MLNKLVFKDYDSPDAEIQAYQSGETQIVGGVGLNVGWLPQLAHSPGLRVNPTIDYEHLDFNLTNPVLTAVNVRKAIEEAIDRCQIITTMFQQPCSTLSVNTILPKPSPDFDPTNTVFGFNLTQARADMSAAGWDCSSGTCKNAEGQPFPMLNLVPYEYAPPDANTPLPATIIQQDLAALGIMVKVTYLDDPNMLFTSFNQGGILATGMYDLTYFSSHFSFDSDGDLYPAFHSSQIPSAQNLSGSNFQRVNDTDVDQGLDEGRTTLDPAQRSKFYMEVQRLLVERVYVIPLYLNSTITLTNSSIGNYLDNPAIESNEWNVGDWFLKR